jgi:CheY-like chemotaxis protein
LHWRKAPDMKLPLSRASDESNVAVAVLACQKSRGQSVEHSLTSTRANERQYAGKGAAMTHRGSMNVMVVEDQQVASSAFRGARISAAADLEEALAAAQATPMDAVLLDLGLPGYRGIEALKRFRQSFPQVPVVVISSNEDSQVIADALEAGASGYIPKALSAAGIAAALRGPRAW